MMKMKELNTFFWVIFSVFLMGYIYVFSQLLVLYLVNIPIAFMASILFPLLLRVVYSLALRYVSSKWTESDVPGYASVRGYVRIWTMRFEWGISIPTVLILSGLVPDGWMSSVFWIIIGLLVFIGYPKYATRVVNRSVSDNVLQQSIQQRFVVISSVIGAMALVIGFAGIILSLIGNLVQ